MILVDVLQLQAPILISTRPLYIEKAYLLNYKTPKAVSDKYKGPPFFLRFLSTIKSIGSLRMTYLCLLPMLG